ncbi:NAD(P)/FAD-dependent oxidoreductase [Salipiger mucosus]|uniref:Sarcosine oxidase beta subunit n=1 Tax=Salipiger mucosus DSM 16094 TaxID=1123237 RepID=S9QL99_9RHOB|nr:FAD-dependent oxidoreductase [Salipiger mucosus]EPX80537.1 Sarcosine oxidase beta subunit [Salipiger mucosus DSM 16094]
MTFDALVIGGGLHGLSAALQAARRGMKVALVERDFLGRHASGATAAGVRTLGRDPAELPLSLEAAETWHVMEELVGDSCGFHATGQVQVAEDEAAMEKLRARVEGLQARGMSHEELIGANELKSLVPAMTGPCVGAAWTPRDGAADPHVTIRAFRTAALAAGVEMHEQCAVTGLSRREGTWIVTTSKGAFEAPVVINAAGAWSAEIARLAGDPLRLGLKHSMMIVTERASRVVAPVISAMGRRLSFKQTDAGTLLIGGGVQGRIHDDGQSAVVDFAALALALDTTRRLFPWTEGLRIVRTWAGMEATTDNHLPIIGFSNRAEGLIHDFGFSGHGFQLVPSVGRVVAELAAEGHTETDLSAFDPARIELERDAA